LLRVIASLHAIFNANSSAALAVDAIRAEILRVGLTAHGAMTIFDHAITVPEAALNTLPIAVQHSVELPVSTASADPSAQAANQRMRQASAAADAALSAQPGPRPTRSGQRPIIGESQLDEAFSAAAITPDPLPAPTHDSVPVEYARTTSEQEERLWRESANFSAPDEEVMPQPRSGQGDATPQAVAARRGQRSVDADAEDLKMIMAGKKTAEPSKSDKAQTASRETSASVATERPRVAAVGRVQPFNGEAIIIPAKRSSRINDVKPIPVAGRKAWLPDPMWMRVMGLASLLAVPLVLCSIAWATGLLGSATNRSMIAVGMITPIPTNTATPTATATLLPTNTPTPTATPLPTKTPVPTIVPTQTPFVVVITAVPTQTPIPTETAVPPTAAAPVATETAQPTATPGVVTGEGNTRRVVRRRPIVRAQPTAVPARRPVVRRPAAPAPVRAPSNGGGQPPLPPPPP
jgi:hypothetical protein